MVLTLMSWVVWSEAAMLGPPPRRMGRRPGRRRAAVDACNRPFPTVF